MKMIEQNDGILYTNLNFSAYYRVLYTRYRGSVTLEMKGGEDVITEAADTPLYTGVRSRTV
jgi:hypothetical protein